MALLGTWEAVPEDMLNVRPALVAAAVLQQRDLTGALPFLVGAAQSAASVIRDRFSPDAWRALTELVEMIRAPFEQGPSESAIFERVNGALRIIASFSGLAQENMSQLAGWRFLEIGRRIERTLATCAFIRQFAFGATPEGGLDVLLELADSQITYRLRYVMVAARGAGDRSRRARSEQSALHRLSARPHRDASRGDAEARRQPVDAARADRGRAGDQDADRRRRRDRRSGACSRWKRR